MRAHMYDFIVLPHLGGFLGLLFTQKVPIWFENLKKPSWHPPNLMSPLAWTTLYTSMGYASYLVWLDLDGFSSRAVMPLGLYITQLALNWAWTPLFFRAHKLKLALIDIVCLYELVLCTIYSWLTSSQH